MKTARTAPNNLLKSASMRRAEVVRSPVPRELSTAAVVLIAGIGLRFSGAAMAAGFAGPHEVRSHALARSGAG